MIGFWLALFGLMVIAVLLLLWPLAPNVSRSKGVAQSDNAERTKINVELYKQRLADISEEQLQGVLDNESAESLRQELQKQLLDDAPEKTLDISSSQPRTYLIFVAALLLPALALIVYSKIGEPEAWTLPILIKQSEQAYEAGVDNTEQLEKLATQLSAFPQRDQFVTLHARILMQLQRYDEAAELFGELQKRFPQDASIIAQSVQARYLASDRNFDSVMESDAKQALQLDPDQPTLLGLLGMYAFEQTRYADAVNYWERLITILPPESAQNAVIQGPLERARLLAKENNQLVSSEQKSSDKNSAASITVSVSASLGKIPPNAILFVFAKSATAGAPPMPLAVQRIPSPSFPLTVKLDDSLAMMPALKLSTVDEVVITARLSTSGDVRGNPGDAQISTSPIKWRELKNTVELQLKL